MTERAASVQSHTWSSDDFSVDPVRLGENSALLADPDDPQFDAIAQLYVLVSKDARLDSASTSEQIQRASEERQLAWEERIQQLEAARQREDDGGFWGSLGDTLGTVAKVAGVVGATALAVGTLGAATPVAALAIAGAVMSSVSLAQSEFGVLERIGFSPEVAKWTSVGLGIGGALATLGASGFALFGETASLAENASAVQRAATTFGHGAAVVAGGASMGAGVSNLTAADAHRDIRRHEANAAEAMLHAQRLQSLLTQLIDQLSEVKERETQNIERITTMNGLQGAALTAAAGGAA